MTKPKTLRERAIVFRYRLKCPYVMDHEIGMYCPTCVVLAYEAGHRDAKRKKP